MSVSNSALTLVSLSTSKSPTLSPFSASPDSPLSSYACAVSSTPTILEPTSFIIPDFISICPFSPTYHDDGDVVSADSINWILSHSPHFTQSQVAAIRGLQAGKLAAFCYNYCPTSRLAVVSDFLTFLFHLDDVSDGYFARDVEGLTNLVMNAFESPDAFRPIHSQPDGVPENSASKVARDFFSRFMRDCSLAVQERFKTNMRTYLQAVQEEASFRTDGFPPDLQTYIEIRRETSACKPVFDLIEYSLDLELPDDVIEHPIIMALNQGANDLVTWANDLFSYNVEQSRRDPNNMVCVFMMHDGLSLQEAVDRVGEVYKQTLDSFIENQKRVPSWGDNIDKDVKLYVNGLQEWIVGSINWSFVTKRYFGDNGGSVKATRIVDLLSKKKEKA